MPFSRVYLEITNCCNLACSFCPGTTRRAAFLTVAQFTHLAGALRGQTRFLYFHVMGEPLLHPDLPELLDIAGRMGFRVVLTTNGTLLPKRQRELLAAQALHKVSVSLHSFEANSGVDMEHYLAGCTDFGLAASEAGILIDYRLWNLDGAETRGRNEQNDAILNHLHAAYPGNWTQNTWGWRLCDRTFIHYGEKLHWPSPDAPDHGEAGTCRALRDQLQPGEYGLFLGTAHPAKFKESVEEILQETLPLPKELADRADLPLLSHNLPADFAALRKLMMG